MLGVERQFRTNPNPNLKLLNKYQMRRSLLRQRARLQCRDWTRNVEQSFKWGIADPVKVWNSPCCALSKLHTGSLSQPLVIVLFLNHFPLCHIKSFQTDFIRHQAACMRATGKSLLGTRQPNIFIKCCCTTSKKVLFRCKIKLLLGEALLSWSPIQEADSLCMQRGIKGKILFHSNLF